MRFDFHQTPCARLSLVPASPQPQKVRFAPDPALEGNGFEPLVPRRKKKRSSGRSTPRVRLGPQGEKRAKPCPLLREPEHNTPAASYSGIACRQALQDYGHFP